MKIKSIFNHNENIPVKYACPQKSGENINPPLFIEDAPEKTRCFVFILDDPDAPTPKPFLHWIMWNIPSNTKEIKENSFPHGSIQGLNGTRKPGYIGPCPPSGIHHYRFKLYALDKELSLKENSSREEVEKEIRGHILASSELVGLFS